MIRRLLLIAALSAAPLAPLPARAADTLPAAAAKWGAEFCGTPYLWGGSSSFGLDCSGFVQLCYRLAGVNLRRDADIQRDDPRFFPVAQDERMPGDLVFFGKPDAITHVGMHFADDTFIHSAGGAGVIISEWGDDRYSPSYVDARRLDPARAADPITRFEAQDR
jgi:cell wall-associated NlpC family hydrolase